MHVGMLRLVHAVDAYPLTTISNYFSRASHTCLKLLILSMTKFVNSSSALLSTSSSQMACRTHALSAWFEEFLISSIWQSTLFIPLKHLMSSMRRYKSLMTTNKFSSILVFAMVLTSQKVISLITTDI